ncbi:MAG: hypothetical protein FWF88_07830 [Peptococcaceae bacterium]|nr:hypothetical protein [Peptococcaceae bacterium]
MTYPSKRTLISIGVGILLLVVYVIYALGDASPAPDDLKLWALALLVYIGACIAAGIVIQILFHIALAIGIAVKEKPGDDKKVERIIKSSMLEDEREKLISLKSSHIGHAFSGFGFVTGLIALAVGSSAVVVLHIMAGAFAVGSIIEGCVSVYHHERGVPNG